MTCSSSDDDTETEILLTQGQDAVIEVVAALDGASYDATDCRVYFTVKEDWRDETPALLKRTANAGGSDADVLVVLPQTGTNKGLIKILIKPSDTSSLDPDRTYVCDCWLVTTSDTTHVIMSMRDFVLMPRVTVVA
jgi:hypothetical protein